MSLQVWLLAFIALPLLLGARYLISYERVRSTLLALAGVIYLGLAYKGTAFKSNHCAIHIEDIGNSTQKFVVRGDNCPRSAHISIIDAEMRDYVQDFGNGVCKVVCLKEHPSHLWWEGYVSTAPGQERPTSYYCGEAHLLGDCGALARGVDNLSRQISAAQRKCITSDGSKTFMKGRVEPEADRDV